MKTTKLDWFVLFLFTALALFILAASASGVFAQPQAPTPLQAPVPPQAPPIQDFDPPPPPKYGPEHPDSTYMNAADAAAVKNAPLVVFVGRKSSSLDGNVLSLHVRFVKGSPPGTVHVSVDSLKGYPAKCVVVAEPDGEGWVNWKATLPESATDIEIAAAIRGQQRSEVAPSRAAPFEQIDQAPIADDKRDWPVGLTFLNDLEPYKSATRVQQTFRRFVGYIGSASRLELEPKWRFPGGLDKIGGWSSRLYKSKNAKAGTFLVRQDPSDGSSAVTWSRSYPDGAIFADVLRNRRTGKIFEIRVAEKQEGEWERYVVYRNSAERPHGYAPLTSKDCRSCHEKAGRSEYGGVAIPGADTILSDPIPVVERGQTVQGGYGTSLQ